MSAAGVFEPSRPGGAHRRLDRLAARLAEAEFRRLVGRADVRVPRWSAAHIAALLVLSGFVGLVALGVWSGARDFPGIGLAGGAVALAASYQLRPRFGNLPDGVATLAHDEAPELRALVALIAARLGTRAPDMICLGEAYAAEAFHVGPARRRVLVLGLPLWLSLSAQQRVALLGHELGHFVNGDPRRGVLIQPVYGALRAGRWLAAPLRLPFAVLVQRGGQRAEYYADALAARVGGSRAAVELIDLGVLGDTVMTLLTRDARAGVPVSAWPTTASTALRHASEQLAVRRERAFRREVSLNAEHPPSRLRARLIEARPQLSAEVLLGEDSNAAIDAELARLAARCVRGLSASERLERQHLDLDLGPARSRIGNGVATLRPEDRLA